MKKEKSIIDEEKALNILNGIYEKVLNGVPKVSKPIQQLADDYLSKHDTPEDAAKALVRAQTAKCGVDGFIAGLGGLIVLPAALPANVGSVLYMQMRMVAAIAAIGGYDVSSDQVQTMVYLCMAGKGASDILKQAGVKVGQKGVEAAIKKIPGAVLVTINKKLGFRFITRFGQKGVVNLGKMIPVAGGIIGGGFDIVSTKIIAKAATKMFLEKEDYVDVTPVGSDGDDDDNLV